MSPWSVPVALVLACMLPQSGAAAPDPSAAPAETTPPVDGASSSPTISDALLRSAEGKRVEIATSGSGTVIGTLTTISEDAVIVVRSDGELVEVLRASIEAVRLVQDVPKPHEAVATPAIATCTGDESCEEPRMCIEGSCQIPPGYTDELREEAEPRIKHGRWMMIAGGSGALAGLVILGAGFGVAGANECTSYVVSADFDGCVEGNPRRADQGFTAGITGTVIAGIGAVVLITGGGMYGMGKNKLKRAERYDRQLDVSFAPTRRGFGVALGGRF